MTSQEPRARAGRPAYRRELASGIVIASTTPAHASQLEALQQVVFPTLAPAQRFAARHYLRHLELFAEGQFVALHGDRVVAATSTIRRRLDFEHPYHTFDDIIQGGWLTSHQPDGDWLYGADLGVHPDYRRQGLALALYAARQELARTLGLRGQVTAGMLSGYGAVKDRLSAREYCDAVQAGTLEDPTLSMQLRVGFEVRALLPGHLDDPTCDGYAALIVLDASRQVPGAPRPASEE